MQRTWGPGVDVAVSMPDQAGASAAWVVARQGFEPQTGSSAPLHLRGPGGGIRMDGTAVVGEPRLHLLGYGPSASTIGANRGGPGGRPPGCGNRRKLGRSG